MPKCGRFQGNAHTSDELAVSCFWKHGIISKLDDDCFAGSSLFTHNGSMDAGGRPSDKL
jgi:hypothetical protein